MFTSAANAQVVTVNDMASVRPGSKLNCVLDFSQATIMGMTEEQFAQYEPDWEKDKWKIVKKFLNGVNGKLDEVLVAGGYKDTPYTLAVTVTTITDVGNVFCNAELKDSQGAVLFRVKEVSGGKDPVFLPGTKLAKIKLWSNLTGKCLGSILKQEYLSGGN